MQDATEQPRPAIFPHSESSLRYRAGRVGWRLEKSRVRNTHYNNRGGYQIVCAYHNVVRYGVDYELTLREVGELVQDEYLKRFHPELVVQLK